VGGAAERVGLEHLAGVRHPTILLPPGLTDRLTPEQLRFVFLHELAHVRRHDPLAEWLLALLTALHWFNPAVWIAARLYRADREIARDAMVLRAVGPDRRLDYGRTLLTLITMSPATRNTHYPAVAMLPGKNPFRQRITMITHFRPTPARLTTAAIR
jgi:bla regulator protein BlaR1